MRSPLNRIVLAAAAASIIVGPVGCGSDAATQEQGAAVNVPASNYVTVAPAASTLPPTTVPIDAVGAVLQFDTEYVIEEGDYASTIANDWGVTLDQLMTLNGWTLDETQNVPEWPGVGATILIPAGGKVPGADPPAAAGAVTDDPATEATDAAAPDTTEPAPDTTEAASACNGEYTIVEGDIPGKVAANFDITVAEMDAANTKTKSYKGFVLGITIVIPKAC